MRHIILLEAHHHEDRIGRLDVVVGGSGHGFAACAFCGKGGKVPAEDFGVEGGGAGEVGGGDLGPGDGV